MFGLSTWEVLIILALALIFVGPDQLPKVARQIGKGVRQVRGAVGKVDDEMRRAMREAAAEIDAGDDDEAKPETPPETPATPLDAAGSEQKAAHLDRDWSQVGKGPVIGRVATATPARPAGAAPAAAAAPAAPAAPEGSEAPKPPPPDPTSAT